MASGKDFRVFVSAVTSEFGEARSLVASDLRSRGLTVKVQEDFRQEAGIATTLAKLHDYIADCDAVVCVIGDRGGVTPTEAEAEPFAEILPGRQQAATYTQWELLFARHHRRRLSVYLAGSDYEPDDPEQADNGHAELQAGFVRWLFDELGLDRGTFSNPDELGRLVLREEWPVHRDKPVVLPYPSLGELFAGRDAFLDRVHASLAGAAEATAITGRVIHGLGGVGKTRLVVEYAWRHLGDYTAVLFVAAETPVLLHQSLAALTAPGALDLPEHEATEENVQVAATLRWLVDRPGWLLIFDNLDTPGAAEAVEKLLPRLRGGQVLMTGRLGDWGAAVDPLELDVLDEADAARFLLDRTERRRRRAETDEADAALLAEELGGLALALEQAGAYVVQRRMSLTGYLDEWRSQVSKVREWHDERVMNYPRSVAVTWQTTLERLGPGERALLRLLAWFAPEPVPTSVFETERAAEAWGAATAALGGEQATGASLLDALAGLASYGMVRWDADEQTVTAHRVVQTVTRERLPVDHSSVWLEATLDLLVAAHPGDPNDVRTWEAWDALRPHYLAAAEYGDHSAIGNSVSYIINELGQLLNARALYDEAEPLMRRALEIDEASYGPDHPTVAVRLKNLAALLHATNRLGKAEPLMRRALAIDEASYGTDHPDVAVDLNNLGQLLYASGRLGEAEPLMRRALAIDEASYGPDHPLVAIRLGNLATLLHAADRFGEAEPLMWRALAIGEASYGPDHPDVAVDLNNLAQLLKASGRLGEAEPLMRRALAIDEASYGPDHPAVARDLSNLAAFLQATDRMGEAEPLIWRALAIEEASHGPDHPNVAIRLNNLAALLQATDRLGEAEPLMVRVVGIFVAFTRETGHQHPHLRAAVGNYAGLLSAMERTQEEIRTAIDDLLESRGP